MLGLTFVYVLVATHQPGFCPDAPRQAPYVILCSGNVIPEMPDIPHRDPPTRLQQNVSVAVASTSSTFTLSSVFRII
jgi:hypothetical protein